MKLPRNLTRKTFAVAGLAAVAWIIVAALMGWRQIGDALGRFGLPAFGLVTPFFSAMATSVPVT